MPKLTYTNERGASVVLGQSAPFFISKLEGFSDVENMINSQHSPYQDGVTVISTNLSERHLTIEGEFLYRDRQKGRDKLIKVFNPKLKGKLRYENGETVKEIECIPEKIPAIGSSTLSTVPFAIYLFSANPFWQDEVRRREDIALWHGAFEFPLEIVEEGIELGYREESLIANIYNSGDVPCGMIIQFKALASLENPSLFNVNTREYFKVNKAMEAGEIVTVVTSAWGKRVEVERSGITENAFNWIELESAFLQLDVGDNLFRYDADSGLDNLEVSIWYTPQYLGV